MPIKSFRPYTPSRRTITVSDYSDITKTTPEKRLTKGLRKTGGRNTAYRLRLFLWNTIPTAARAFVF